jgi:hypothetical protein
MRFSSLSFLAVVLGALLLASAPSALAQETSDGCDSILAYGLHNRYETYTNINRETLLENTFKEMSRIEESRNVNLGVTLPIEGIPVPTEASYGDSFLSAYKKYKESKKMDNIQITEKTFRGYIDPNIIQAWLDCKNGKNGLKQNVKIYDKQVSVTLTDIYQPDNGVTRSDRILSKITTTSNIIPSGGDFNNEIFTKLVQNTGVHSVQIQQNRTYVFSFNRNDYKIGEINFIFQNSGTISINIPALSHNLLKLKTSFEVRSGLNDGSCLECARKGTCIIKIYDKNTGKMIAERTFDDSSKPQEIEVTTKDVLIKFTAKAESRENHYLKFKIYDFTGTNTEDTKQVEPPIYSSSTHTYNGQEAKDNKFFEINGEISLKLK